jgi:HAE1 family hydrophobic/amphiphilic exporter-1
VLGILVEPIDFFFSQFNRGFKRLSEAYGALTRRLLGVAAVMAGVYVALIGLAYFQFARTPSGFVSPLDRGYFIAAITLPPGASLQRTDRVVRDASQLLLSRPGVANAVSFAGFDGANYVNAPNSGVVFVVLKPFNERVKAKLSTQAILDDLRRQMQALREASTLVIQPPSVPGIGTGGGFKMYVEDGWRRGRQGEPDAWSRPGVHALQHFNARGLRRHRSHQSGDARSAHLAIL